MPRLRHPYKDKIRPSQYSAKIRIEGDSDTNAIVDYLNNYYDTCTWKYRIRRKLANFGFENDYLNIEEVKFTKRGDIIYLLVNSAKDLSQNGLYYMADVCEESIQEINENIFKDTGYDIKLVSDYRCIFDKE